MQINFLQYFQVHAAAKGNVPYLLSLDLLLANEGIRRQSEAEVKREEERIRSFESSVETAYKQLTSGNAGQSA